jgi:predicted dehydrogenase
VREGDRRPGPLPRPAREDAVRPRAAFPPGPPGASGVSPPEQREIRTAVVGVGYLGRHHARIHASMPGARLVAVVDIDAARAEAIGREHGAEALTDARRLEGRVDAVSLAVPTVHHAEIGCALLERGIDLLVEKPIAESLPSADALIRAAGAGGRILQVGHTERYNPAVEALGASVARPRFIEVHRLGVFSPRSIDIDVVLDLMIHDLDLIMRLTGSEPERVEAIGVSALTERVDIANARLVFPGSAVANVTASRISAQKVRKLRVFERRAYHSLDFTEQQVERYALVEAEGRREIERTLLPVAKGEPLRREIASFIDCVRRRESPSVTGEDGRRALALAMRIAAAAAESSRQ